MRISKKGSLKIQGLMLALITAFGLFFGLIGYTMDTLGSNYDNTGYDAADINKYNYLEDMSTDINNSKGIIENVRVESNVFDWFAGVWNKLTAPFKLIYRSYDNLITATKDSATTLGLPPIFKAYFNAAIIILVVIGIVMIKFYLGRKK